MEDSDPVSKITAAMSHAVPRGRTDLSAGDITVLRGLTRELTAAKQEARAEYERFLAIRDRELCLPEAELRQRLSGAAILVTGGTGCIGSSLIARLTRYGPRRLASVSRGIRPWSVTGEVICLQGDVRDRTRIDEIIAQARPDIIFHCAAQRSPALAEVEVHRTVSTNVLGARNVLAAARAAGVPQVVLASTGKALRPYSPEVYTASKRAAEWIAATEAGKDGMLVSAARFTHVFDNSLVHEQLLKQASTGGVLRLHSPDIGFYVQSAAESAQLLLLACLGAVPGEFRVHAITGLGWPVSLLDVALGVIGREGSASPVYISGYDPGYEEVPFPGLYDPATAGDVSPLFNAFEAAAQAPPACPMTGACTLEMAESAAAGARLRMMEKHAENMNSGEIRLMLDSLSWLVLDATLAAADRTALNRCAGLAEKNGMTMSPVHRSIVTAVRKHARLLTCLTLQAAVRNAVSVSCNLGDTVSKN